MSETQVLARKWRPKTFAELTGQEHVVRALTNALDQKRLHHAYLFTGTRGVGKTTLARILAKSLNCEAGITSRACNVCRPCTEIDSGRFVDLIELDAASNTQVDNMRELLESALYAPTSGRFKVYIIDEVHMLSKSAFNAMLKTLEEPPEHVKFILATTDPQKIPVTVLSRCLQFNLKQIPPQLISDRLRHVLDQEHVSYDGPALQLIARLAQGSMRDALSLLDQAIPYGGGRVEESAVLAMVGAVDQGYLFDLLDRLADQDGPGLIAVADRMEAMGISFEAALQDLASLLHRMALAQIVPDAFAEDSPDRERIFSLAEKFSPEQVQLDYQIAIRGRDEIGLAPDDYAGLTMTLMRMLAFTMETGEPGPSATAPNAPAGGTGRTPGTIRPGAGPSTSAPAHPRPAAVESSSAPKTGEPSGAAPPQPASGKGSVIEFDGDWPGLLDRIKLGGMARMLAQHCEVRRFDESGLELCVPEAHRHLMEKAYQDRLKAAVVEYFGRPVPIRFTVGSVTGMTPAEIQNRERQQQQERAIEAIESDPFVRDMVENFDARLIESSIKPIQ